MSDDERRTPPDERSAALSQTTSPDGVGTMAAEPNTINSDGIGRRTEPLPLTRDAVMSVLQSESNFDSAAIVCDILQKFDVLDPTPQISAQQLIATVVRAAHEQGGATTECRHVAAFFARMFSSSALVSIKDTLDQYRSNLSITLNRLHHEQTATKYPPPPPMGDGDDPPGLSYELLKHQVRSNAETGLRSTVSRLKVMWQVRGGYETCVRLADSLEHTHPLVEVLRSCESNVEIDSSYSDECIRVAFSSVIRDLHGQVEDSTQRRCFEEQHLNTIIDGLGLSLLAEWGEGTWLAFVESPMLNFKVVPPAYIRAANRSLFLLDSNLKGTYRSLTNVLGRMLERNSITTVPYEFEAHHEAIISHKQTGYSFAELLQPSCIGL